MCHKMATFADALLVPPRTKKQACTDLAVSPGCDSDARFLFDCCDGFLHAVAERINSVRRAALALATRPKPLP